MPKLKTMKAVAKRLKVTGRRKLLARTAGQDHFNSREPGKVTRAKRRDRNTAKADQRSLRAVLPYVAPAAKTPKR